MKISKQILTEIDRYKTIYANVNKKSHMYMYIHIKSTYPYNEIYTFNLYIEQLNIQLWLFPLQKFHILFSVLPMTFFAYQMT